VPDFPSDADIPLDGTVGSLEPLEEPVLIAGQERVLRVFVSGDEVNDARAVGLAEDLRLLVQRFINGVTMERERPSATPPSARHGDVKIYLHGLRLDPAEEAELRHLMWKLVRDRLGKGSDEE
jgi:hypothetical protein